MSLVGKRFPSITVETMSEMGDNLKINIFDEAVNNNKKVLLFWYPKDFTFVNGQLLNETQTNKAEELAELVSQIATN